MSTPNPLPSAENDAGLGEAAKWLRGVAEKCCQCTDGHHAQQYAYGTEDDVRLSRDTVRALADLLESVTGHVEREAVMTGGHLHRQALAVARGVLTGSVTSPDGHDHEKCCRYLQCAHPMCCGYRGEGRA